MGAVTQQRPAFFVQGCEHHFPISAFLHRLQCVGIDDFHKEVIIPIMHAAVMMTVDGNTRAIDFGQTINIKDFNPQLIYDTLTHFITPAF